MIESPTSSNISDFKQRYSGVIGWYVDAKTKDKTLVAVSTVGSDRVQFKDAAGANYYANVDANVQFEFLPVEKAWRNTKDTAYYVHRIPARQYKRGICAENTSIAALKDLLRFNGDIEVPWRTKVFNIYSTPQDYQAFTKQFLNGKREEVAISTHFAIGHGRVWFYNLMIGLYTADTKTIDLNTNGSMVLQELTDLIRRNGYPFLVKEAK